MPYRPMVYGVLVHLDTCVLCRYFRFHGYLIFVSMDNAHRRQCRSFVHGKIVTPQSNVKLESVHVDFA